MSALRKIMTKDYGTFRLMDVVRFAFGMLGLPMEDRKLKLLYTVNAFNIGMMLAGGMTWQWFEICFWGLALTLPIASRGMRPKPVQFAEDPTETATSVNSATLRKAGSLAVTAGRIRSPTNRPDQLHYHETTPHRVHRLATTPSHCRDPISKIPARIVN